MDDKIKITLKLLKIWYVTAFTLCLPSLIIAFLGGDLKTIDSICETIIFIFLPSLLAPFLLGIIFSPAIFALYILFKKIKNINYRMVLTSFMFPFVNLIYYSLACIIDGKTNDGFYDADLSFYPMIIGSVTMFAILPIAIIASLFIPKTLIPYKKHVIGGIALMFVFGLILMIIALRLFPQLID